MDRRFVQLAACFVAWGAAVTVEAAPPILRFLPFTRRNVDARSDVRYELSPVQGPWMILAASFSGAPGAAQADELVFELRRRFNLPAYVHAQKYDYTGTTPGVRVDRYGELRQMRNLKSVVRTEHAVLVGNFKSADDPQLTKALQQLKRIQPECLVKRGGRGTAQNYAHLRLVQRVVNNDKRDRGPMSKAFATRNPMAPAAAVAPQLDPLVVRMNEQNEFSLFRNPGQFTVRVARFRGDTVMDLERSYDPKAEPSPKLIDAAVKAHRMVELLRQKGVEAYEFHDLHESIVTIGAFASIGRQLPGGSTELDPAIQAIVATYGAEKVYIPERGSNGLRQRELDGIKFDVQPAPVVVPKHPQARRRF